MKSMPLEIRLQTNDDTKVLRFVELEKFDDGSGYRCRVIASSGGFSCDRPFYFDDSSNIVFDFFFFTFSFVIFLIQLK